MKKNGYFTPNRENRETHTLEKLLWKVEKRQMFSDLEVRVYKKFRYGTYRRLYGVDHQKGSHIHKDSTTGTIY